MEVCRHSYVPGGRFAHVCSALMSVATAKAAGVPTVIACSPPRGPSIDPALAFAMSLAGADIILEMGWDSIHCIAGFRVVHRKASQHSGWTRQRLCGRGQDHAGQHGTLLHRCLCRPDRIGHPGRQGRSIPKPLLSIWFRKPSMATILLCGYLQTISDLANRVLQRMDAVILDMPKPDVPQAAWRDFGEIILCFDREEMCRVSNRYAPEHVQVMSEDISWWVRHLACYGSLFLGVRQHGAAW